MHSIQAHRLRPVGPGLTVPRPTGRSQWAWIVSQQSLSQPELDSFSPNSVNEFTSLIPIGMI